MTSKRNISKTAPVSGATFTADVADTVNALSAYLGGNAVTVAGTNTITCTIDITSGFTGPGDGMLLAIDPANDNTGAVTLNIASTGAKAVVNADGTALSGGELETGTLYLLFFVSADDHWRIVSAQAQEAAATPTSRILAESDLIVDTGAASADGTDGRSFASTAWNYTAPETTTKITVEGSFLFSIDTTSNTKSGDPDVEIQLKRDSTVMATITRAQTAFERGGYSGTFHFEMEVAAGVTAASDWTVDLDMDHGDNCNWVWLQRMTTRYTARSAS